MLKIKKSVVLIAIVIVVSVFTYYHYAVKVLQAPRDEGASPMTELPVAKQNDEGLPIGSKEVSAVTVYDVAAAEVTHNVRFTLVVDADGVITAVKLVEAPTNVASDKQTEFSEGLATVIRGKKLAELSAVDRIGKSTLTTDAFNSVLDELKTQL